MSIKKRVLDLCNERKVRIGTLERETGMSNGTIRQWSDDSQPSVKTISKIADYFGVSVESILVGEQKEKTGIPADLSESHRVLIDRILQLTVDQADAYLQALDAFLRIQ